MKRQPEQPAMFPGTFEPIANGHLDVAQRGRRLFDGLLLAVRDAPRKPAMPDQQHLRISREVIAGMPNVRAEPFPGLTVNFPRKLGAAVILPGGGRGLFYTARQTMSGLQHAG